MLRVFSSVIPLLVNRPAYGQDRGRADVAVVTGRNGSDRPDYIERVAAPRITMIGVGNLLEVIWPTIDRNVGGSDAGSRFIGVTADAADLDRKTAHFGFEMVLNDNLGALRRNHPDLIMFAPPPTIAPELIESVLRPYYDERRAGPDPLPVLYAFPPMPAGEAYLRALGSDVLVANIIPNNVTTIAGVPIDDEGYYVCTFPSPWPPDRFEMLRAVFDGQGACIELEPDQLIPMLGAAATVSALWYLVPMVADRIGADHNLLGRFLRARLDADDATVEAPPHAELSAAMIDGWRSGIERYYGETEIDRDNAELLVARGLDLTLHTIEAEPRAVLTGHSVGAATAGGVLEKAIDIAGSRLLPAVEAGLLIPADAVDGEWKRGFADLVTSACHSVREHGATLAG